MSSLLWQATYLPYGYENNAQIGVNKFKFTDYQRDAESGLDYAKARYYNSNVARFMSPDPIAGDVTNPQSWNRYADVMNNSVNFNDPSGLSCYDPHDGQPCIIQVTPDPGLSGSPGLYPGGVARPNTENGLTQGQINALRNGKASTLAKVVAYLFGASI